MDQLLVSWALHEHISVSQRWLPLGVVSWLIALVFLLFAYQLTPENHTSIGWVLIWAGVASNLLTIVTRGTVVDYIPLIWWVVNVADIALTVGIAIIFFSNTKKAPN